MANSTDFRRRTEAASPPQFFVNQKRGEISELRLLLRSLPAENANNPGIKAKRREVLKKLIAYMTLGIDVSLLFPEVVLASATNDPVQKKLLALYMSNYAELNPELSILAINALQKDLLDIDPRIRGLALKALTSLRVPSVAEYAETAVYNGLEDPASYVRRSAIIGVLKLLDAKMEVRNKEYLITAVKKGLHSLDSQLFINSLLVLNEIDHGFETSRKTIVQLFNKLDHCSIFGKVLVLSLLSEYIPRDQNEMLGLLDTLETNFSVSNASLLLATIKVMIIFAKSQMATLVAWSEAPLIQSILQRARPSLLTLMNSASMESVFVILVFIHQLVKLSEIFARLFEKDWSHFTLRHIDKSYNKILKLCILGDIATEATWLGIKQSIMMSLSPPTCVSYEVLSSALKVLGNLAVRFAAAAPEILSELAFLTTLEMPHVCSAVIPVIAFILATHSALAGEALPFMSFMTTLELLDNDALRAVVWMTGEFPKEMPSATEIIEQLIDIIFERETPQSAVILNDIIIACSKIIYVDPGSIQATFSKLLTKISRHANQLPPIVVDRLATITRLLTRRPRFLTDIYSPQALAEDRNSRKIVPEIVSVLPNVTLQKLDSLCSVVDEPESMDFIQLPFGGFYSDASMHVPTPPVASPSLGVTAALVHMESPFIAASSPKVGVEPIATTLLDIG